MNVDKVFKKKRAYSFLASTATELDETRNIRLFAALRIKEKNGKRVIIASHTPLNSRINLKDLKEETDFMLDNVASPTPLTHTHNVTDDGWRWHMYSDTNGIIYMFICATTYPTRVAHKCIEEFQQKFSIRFGADSSKAKENALNKEFRPIFEALVNKYQTPDEHDAATNALSKIAEVKNVMHENVELSMKNTTTLEAISRTTEKLETQASVFKRSTDQLSKDLWWQRFRCSILAGVMILLLALGCAGFITFLVIKDQQRREREEGAVEN